MIIDGVDYSGWPPALAFALCVIVLVCRVLPDVLTITSTPRTSRRS